MPDLSKVKTIIIVMLENRSFDHMLGHLSHPSFGNNKEVDGLGYPYRKYENLYNSAPYPPFIINKDEMLLDDAPHEREEIKTQLAYSDVTGTYTMSGFVEAYFNKSLNEVQNPMVMGFYRPDLVPITTFLANNFAVCDRWFSPLPTSTVPNRLMALGGDTRVDKTGGITEFFRPLDDILLDWLDEREIKWRVYHAGISFFALLRRFSDVLGPKFRSFNKFPGDFYYENENESPEVVIIEPSYYDAPRIGDQPNDNHAPLSIGFGEQFLREIYQAVTSNPKKWSETVMIVTYDEHGGFYDHVPPLMISYEPPDREFAKFKSTGPRVPTIIVSPFVSKGSVIHNHFDHTSILQFIAERFAPTENGYSPSVNKRKEDGIDSISKVLRLNNPRKRIPAIHNDIIISQAEFGNDKKKKGLMQTKFKKAALEMIRQEPVKTNKIYPGIIQWQITNKLI